MTIESNIEHILWVLSLKEVGPHCYSKRFYELGFLHKYIEVEDSPEYVLNCRWMIPMDCLAFLFKKQMVGVQVDLPVPQYPKIKWTTTIYYYHQAKQIINNYLSTHFYPGNSDTWWDEQSQPIHWIVCYLIFLELKEG
jgi:hypothetical protein